MSIKRAIPSDIDFFQGESVFFQPSDTSSPTPSVSKSRESPIDAKTERVNGRTTQPNERTGERSSSTSKLGNEGTDEQTNGITKHKNDEVTEPAQSMPIQANKHADEQSLSSATSMDDLPANSTAPSPLLTLEGNDVSPSLPGASILERLKQGKSDNQEHTERYSFEIYPRQKEHIEDFLYQYKKRTGEKLSASKLIREALTLYFHTLENGKNR